MANFLPWEYPHFVFYRRDVCTYNLSDVRIKGINKASKTIRQLKKQRRRDEITEGGLERLERLESRRERLRGQDSLSFEVTGKNQFKFSLVNSCNDNILKNGDIYLNLRNTTDGVTTITPLVRLGSSTSGFAKAKRRLRGVDFTGDQVDIIVSDSFDYEPIDELTVNIV
tara:strand:+ start:100 stop:606 length:507 start_codon:yes stop_codon:yes gene_type:complete